MQEPVATPRPAPVAKQKIETQKREPKKVETATPAARDYQSNQETPRMIDAAEYAINPPTQYPLLARRRKYQGTVLLSVTINAAGHATSVTVQESSGHSILDDEAKRVVASWRFVAATENGEAVASQVIVPIRFMLQE
jgi:protein TonB